MALSVGIIGLIGSGKDTFGDMLLERLQGGNSRFTSDSYARPLKQLGAKVLGLAFSTIDIRDVKEFTVPFKYNGTIEDILYKFMQDELLFTGVELSEALRKTRKILGALDSLSPRQFYQSFGTEVVRAVRDSAWVDYLHNKYKYKPVVVKDVRFENELCDINFLVCRFDNIPRPEHVSEQLAWDLQFDKEHFLGKDVIKVYNTGDLESLSCTADAGIRYLKEVKLI